MIICVWSGTSFEKPYASYHLMEEIIKRMLNANHEVYLVQMKKGNGDIPRSLEKQEKLHIINISWKEVQKNRFVERYLDSIKYYFVSFKQIVKIKKIDAIFLQSNNVAYFPINMAKKRKIPVLYNVQDIFPLDALAIRKISEHNFAFIVSRILQKKAYMYANRVVTISEDMANTIREEQNIDIDVVFNWSYQNQAYNISDENNNFLKKYNIKRQDGFRVVYAGNIGQMFDVEMFVKVASALKKYDDIIVYIIGIGTKLDYLKYRVEKKELANVRFYPMQPMEFAPDNYCMADVNINFIPRGVIKTCMPSKINTCLLCQKPTVISMDLDSDMSKRLSGVDQWKVIEAGDYNEAVRAILEFYYLRESKLKSYNSVDFINKLGPIENANKYIEVIERMIR